MRNKILLVDDKTEFRKLVKLFLSKNYDVETAENGLQALSLLSNGYIPNIIISDLVMPEVDGRTLVSQLKSSGVFNHIPVIILSCIDKSSERIELIKAGANDFLIKPFNPEELEIRIENILKIVA